MEKNNSNSVNLWGQQKWQKKGQVKNLKKVPTGVSFWEEQQENDRGEIIIKKVKWVKPKYQNTHSVVFRKKQQKWRETVGNKNDVKNRPK